MGRLIDADKFEAFVIRTNGDEEFVNGVQYVLEKIDNAPTVEAIPKDQINKAIEKIEEYICDVETDTVKAQGMAQALDIFEQVLGEVEDGDNNQHN